jgi:predicted DNA binding CopG/RHH family protein
MRKQYNLKKLKKRPAKIKVDPDAVKTPISLRLDAGLLLMLKTESERRGLPYQTFISSILHQFMHGELIERSTVELLKKVM